jgi:hypothetical protein
MIPAERYSTSAPMGYSPTIRRQFQRKYDIPRLTRHFLLDFRRPFQTDFRPVATSEQHINTGAKPGKIRRFFAHLFDWLISDGRAAKLEKEELRLDARTVASRVGDEAGTPVWRVVMQVRSKRAAYDTVYRIHLESQQPPDASELLGHLGRRQEDFEFVTFLPKLHNKPENAATGDA